MIGLQILEQVRKMDTVYKQAFYKTENLNVPQHTKLCLTSHILRYLQSETVLIYIYSHLPSMQMSKSLALPSVDEDVGKAAYMHC